MEFAWVDATVTLSVIATVTLAAIDGFMAYGGLRAKLDELWESRRSDTNRHAQQHEENQKRMAAIELQIERDCVKKTDFTRFEERLEGRFQAVERKIDESGKGIAQIVEKTMVEVLWVHVPRRGGQA